LTGHAKRKRKRGRIQRDCGHNEPPVLSATGTVSIIAIANMMRA
jgi:hypothetical protein